MDNSQNIKLKYPIGKADIPEIITERDVKKWIDIIEGLPEKLTVLTANLNANQLETPYRKGGWTIRQVIHHLADSHLNSFIRFKWTLTENQPVIKAYYEDRWAELPDSQSDISLSLDLLRALHRRWVILLKNLDHDALERTFIHPEGQVKVSLAQNIGIYAWHGEHHYAHIENLLKRRQWI